MPLSRKHRRFAAGAAMLAGTAVLAPRGASPGSPATARTTFAYVSDATGLVPIDLGTQTRAAPILIPGFDASAGVVADPRGGTAYVLTVPKTTDAGPHLEGPTLVPIDLTSHRLGKAIPFRASAFRAPGGTAHFDLSALAISPDGGTVLVADGADHALVVIDVARRAVARPVVLPFEAPVTSLIRGTAPLSVTPGVHPADLGGLAISPSGRRAYVAEGYDVVPVSLRTHQALPAITGFEAPDQIAIAPSGRRAYVTNPYCWTVLRTARCGTRPARPVDEPNGRIAFSASGDAVSVVDLRSDRIVHEISVGTGAQPTGIALSPDGRTAYVSYARYGERGDLLSLVDTRTDAITDQIRDTLPATSGQGVADLAVAPGGHELVMSGFSVLTPGPGTRQPLRGALIVTLPHGPLRAVRFGPVVRAGESTGPVAFGG